MYEKVMFELIKEKGFKINNIVKKLWMNKDILYLKKCGHAIGLHSYSHPMMFHLLNEQDQYKDHMIKNHKTFRKYFRKRIYRVYVSSMWQL